MSKKTLKELVFLTLAVVSIIGSIYAEYGRLII